MKISAGKSSSSEESADDELQTKPIVKWYLTNSDSDEDNVQCTVRSKKDKRNGEIKEVIKRIEQAVRIRDVTQVHQNFESLLKAYNKTRRVINNEQKIPRFYIKILTELDNFINQCWNDIKWRDALTKPNSNNFNTLRQKFRRYLNEHSLEKEINAYREKLDVDVSETDEQSDSGDELPTVQPYEKFLKDQTVENPRVTVTEQTSEKVKSKLPISSRDQQVEKVDTDVEDEAVTEEKILKKLDVINSNRGKRGIDHREQLDYLELLQEHVEKQNFSVEIKMKILVVQMTTGLDYHQKKNEYLKMDIWTRTLDYVEEFLTLVELRTDEMLGDMDDVIITIIPRMDEEFRRILQNTDPYSQDYVDRLKDEFRICSILDRFKIYLESQHHIENGILPNLCTVYLHIIEHIYYKYNRTADQSSFTLVDRLCKFIYTHDGLKEARDRAYLYQIYHLALHDYYHEARKLMLMCHIQDVIQSCDLSTQIFYNRTIVQLGLSAFRSGAIEQAHQALVDIQSGHHLKEFLGQDEGEYSLPVHMHINLQLVECVYLISAMIIEIPTRRKHRVSKHFHIVMCQAEKQVIVGPPESIREHIVAACRAMKTGDWKTCVQFLINEKMNKKVWNLMPQGTEGLKILINKIKEESLRIYLFTYANVFDSISILKLVDMFELPVKQVHSIIGKMIINNELMGTIDESNQIIVMHQSNSSKTQTLSVELMEKAQKLYEQNEKLSRFSRRSIDSC